jgi:hypothetical protein
MTTAHKWTYDYSPATRRAGIIDATGYSVVRPCLSGRMAALIVAEHNRTVDRLTEPAAFPAMLAALKAVAACPQAAVFLAMLPMPDGSASTYDAVTAAIAQAESEVLS